MTSRRDFLKHLSSPSVLACSMETAAFPHAARSRNGAASLRWPEPIGSPVLESLRPAIENSRDVFTHVDKIIEVAGWMAYEELPMPQYELPSGVKASDPNDIIDLIMVANTIDTAFTNFSTHVKFQIDYEGQHWSDSDAMFACLKRAMNDGIPILDGSYLAEVTRLEMEKIFAGNMEMPMLDEKIEVWHQVGGVLKAKYSGRFRNFIKSCPPKLYDNGNGLVERMAKEFPRFNDVSPYDGHEIKIYKLAQLGLWFVYTTLHQSGHFQLGDVAKMTTFADYIVPVALRLLGITSYSPALEHAIDTYQLVPRNSTQEVEIRAHSIYSTALLREEINKIRTPDRQIIIPQIDARLWTHYHTTTWPHHLTRTIMY
ncbi:MAG: queuosine salvage family protein [Candidatus Acidiferrales bacterium]